MMKKFGPVPGRYVDGEYRPPRPSLDHEWIDGEWRLPDPEEPATDDAKGDE